jgi:predicted porin
MWGEVDTAIANYANSTRNAATGRTVTRSRNQLFEKARLGFRGVEDLGGGISASFWLQGVIDNGYPPAMTFNEWATVSLSGPFGEIRMGLDPSPTFRNEGRADPFLETGVGTNLLSIANVINPRGNSGGLGGSTNYVSTTDSLSYLLPPNLGGFYGHFMYAFGEEESKAGRYGGFYLGRANGPYDISVAYGKTRALESFPLGGSVMNEVRFSNIVGSWISGNIRLTAEFSRSRSSGRPGTEAFSIHPRDTGFRGYLVGLTLPLGVGMLHASYARLRYDRQKSIGESMGTTGRPRAEKWAIGYVHSLSRRTSLYASLSRLTNHDGTRLVWGGPDYHVGETGQLTPKRSSAYELGIRHLF